jgi:NADH-quinone oxidoreductase subunit E
MLTTEEQRAIEEEVTRYPQKRAACIDALKIVQQQHGWVSDDSVKDIATQLDMSPDELDSVATFYNLIYRRPVGRHVIHICNSVSCWVMGYDALLESITQRLGIQPGETTADGRFTLLPIVCLGTCDHAPALMIDEELYRDLSPETVGAILDKYS